MRRALALLIGLAALLAAPAAARAAKAHMTVLPSPVPGVQHLHFEFGPVHISPGQNDDRASRQRRSAAGARATSSRFRPEPDADADGTMPRVDVIHLHHGGLARQRPAPMWRRGRGEDDRHGAAAATAGATEPSDRWLMNYMIHNLTPTPTDVYITYDIDFIPTTSPAAQGMHDGPDAVGRRRAASSAYPVFNALQGSGQRRALTPTPTTVRAPSGANIGSAQRSGPRPTDVTLVATAGHLHPGGL